MIAHEIAFDLQTPVSYPHMPMKVLLIADSPDFDSAYIARNAKSADSIIVTDGALNKLPPLGHASYCMWGFRRARGARGSS